MEKIDLNQPRVPPVVYRLLSIAIPVALVFIVYWGLTHRPVRQLEATEPPFLSVLQFQKQSANGTEIADMLLSNEPGDVFVQTLDGIDVCSGYPVGTLGFSLRCGVPSGTNLFRVTRAGGDTSLAVRYNAQTLIDVSRQ